MTAIVLFSLIVCFLRGRVGSRRVEKEREREKGREREGEREREKGREREVRNLHLEFLATVCNSSPLPTPRDGTDVAIRKTSALDSPASEILGFCLSFS